jgi:ferric-dicitrate binding protein FerR (iron transport regulator)
VTPNEPNSPDARGGDVSPSGRPRWVKVALAVAAGLIALFVVLQLVSGGEHGPGRHTGLGEAPAVVDEDGRGHLAGSRGA